MRADKKTPLKADKKVTPRGHKRGVIGYSKKSALLEDAITQMNAGKYGRSSAALKELLALDPLNMEARRLFATLHLRLGSLLPARQAFESLANEALERQDYWLAESLLREYLAAGPRCVPFIEKLGAVYQEKGDALAAAEEFAKAIDILIEDPDADRPTRPAELYAKIRDLAPASSPAFRLASHFDAQTGDLVTHAAPASASQPEEVQESTVVVEQSESITPTISTVVSEPVSGVMPWDDVLTSGSMLPVQSHQSESPDQTLSPPVRFESSAELPLAPVASPLSGELSAVREADVEPARLEPSFIPSPSIPNSDTSGLIALSASEGTLVSPSVEMKRGIDSASSVLGEDVASLPRLHDSVTVSLNEAIRPVEMEPISQSDVPAPSPSSTSDTLPAPLPWEQVEDATVTIAQPDVEPLSENLSSVGLSLARSPEGAMLEPGAPEPPKEPAQAESFIAASEETRSSATTQEFSPDVIWSAPDTSATESISSPSLSLESSLAGSVGEGHRSDAVIESASPPMPWEQVQEASVDIEGLSQKSITLKTAGPTAPAFVQPLEAVFGEVGDESAHGTITTSTEPGNAESHGAISVSASEASTSPENTSALIQEQKDSKFSWSSIFNSAWKFGSSSPAPHDSLHFPVSPESAELAEPVLSEEATDAPILQEELPVPVSLSETPESISVSASSAEPVISPLPWDQIQETSVTIPPADVVTNSVTGPSGESSVTPMEVPDEGVAQDPSLVVSVPQEELTPPVILNGAPESIAVSASPIEPVVSPLPWEQIQETPVTIPPADVVLSSAAEVLGESPVAAVDVSGKVTVQHTTGVVPHAEVPDESMGAFPKESRSVETAQGKPVESSFRFAHSKSVAVQTDHSDEVSRLECSILPVDMAEEAPLVASPVPTDNISPVGLEAVRIASQAEPVVATQEPSRLDAPAPSGQPVSAASAEPASPVLPYELLPVLQTLVDQLSVVTKTIPVVAPEAKSPEPDFPEQGVVKPATTLREPSKAPSSAELAANPSSAQTPPAESGVPSQWKTGEVAVQTHRPSEKKPKYSMGQASESPSLHAEAQSGSSIEPEAQIGSTVGESGVSASVPAQEKEDWVRTGEAIRFVDSRVTEFAHLSPPPPVAHQEWSPASEPSIAASAVDVLFQSTGSQVKAQSFERPPASPKPRPRFSAKLARVRISLSVFIASCFSTSRALVTSIVGLAVLCVAILAMAVGAVGLTWLVLEEKPSLVFQSLTTPPQRTMMDSHKNGYLLLLGFVADSAADPVQAGYERKPDSNDAGMAAVCQGGDENKAGSNQRNASASVVQGWYRSADPTGQFKAQADSLKDWMGQASVSIGRYRQWLKMPFEDWGHGQAITPPCAAILFAHQLHVADGFSQGANTEAGVERLESDMEMWRTTLGQAKSLPVKMMALQAINDDIAVASGLLTKPDFDGKSLSRMTKMLRPLDPVESSMRWPMQSQLVLAAKSYAAQLDADRGEGVPLHVSVASMLPLPKQRRFNDYAEYYEASYKAAGEGRYGAMPKRSTYIKHPANSVMDYLTNPIENIIGVDPLPSWDYYNGLVIDTDAHLRLASLQAWLRHGPQDADLLARIAKAGQRFYDPYTGLPMLVNIRRGVMYSVGHDGKDQDADSLQDVVVSIPLNQSSSSSAKASLKSK